MKILIVDDDPAMRESFDLMLSKGGDDLHFARDRDEAMTLVECEPFDVVVLDQNLQGEDGGPIGLELIPQIRSWSPGASILVVSGYWDREGVISRALEAGAVDYLVKGPALRALLKARLRQISREVATRRGAFLTHPELETRLHHTWHDLRQKKSPQEKGRLLERLVGVLFRLVGGFRDVVSNVDNALEEIDLMAFAGDDTWYRQSPVWLVECKNWSSSVGRRELDVLVGKMGRRHGQCRVGLMIAWGGVSEPFVRGAHLQQDWVVAIVDQKDLESAIATPDRAVVLQRWIDRAVALP